MTRHEWLSYSLLWITKGKTEKPAIRLLLGLFQNVLSKDNINYIPIFTKSHSEFSNFELPLLLRNSTYVVQILCRLSYEVWSTFITKFAIIELFIVILDIPLSRWFWQERSQRYKVTFDAKFWRPFPRQNNLSWNWFNLIGCNTRSVLLLFNCWNEVHTGGEVYGVSNWIKFGRDCKDWKYKDLKLKRCRQRIWLWGKTGRENLTSELNLLAW